VYVSIETPIAGFSNSVFRTVVQSVRRAELTQHAHAVRLLRQLIPVTLLLQARTPVTGALGAYAPPE